MKSTLIKGIPLFDASDVGPDLPPLTDEEISNVIELTKSKLGGVRSASLIKNTAGENLKMYHEKKSSTLMENNFNFDTERFVNIVTKLKDGTMSEEEISNIIETGLKHMEDKEKLDKLNSFLGTELGRKCNEILNTVLDEE